MIKLCRLDAIPENGSKGFTTVKGDFFAVKKASKIYLYENSCPHMSINLEWQPDQFLDHEKRLIQCATHGAQFLMETGECVVGPCEGDHLTQVSYKILDDTLYLPD
ncbi:Rieske (2Fe-2S) protein [Kistimonas asteriae]|uniref:Rieske (2Fe-2S) protein n=1 Tax=Kistimonas asteriae TaxID=517724 RepID=UPI001BAC8214|nr:Rieske 2Fe-2S domain-containing protein [Kistimonas asteriae]